MEACKFIVELHTDGSMTWSEYTDGSMTWPEYTEPNSREDWDLICSRAFQRAADDLKTSPCCHYSPAAKVAYLAGAARTAAILRKAL